ncbi:acetyl-CoA C-acyltransferase [Aquimarina agarivorans]|uniref:acetyl-CoA C-acyltransferase n=1 Tax=Aquimarina agarivorans TaxID=980584 RepID=UPI000248EC2E|nr:acetyl-CoA C-acyltransferase [Aquimarina agarivorans]
MSKSKSIAIISAVRTPIGSFLGSLSNVPATELGAIAIKAAIEKANIAPSSINEVFMGHVLQANCGQAPARQAAMGAGLPDSVPCTTVNKVCASGLKSVILATQALALGDSDIVIAGGMENMSQAPHYSHLRNGYKFGNADFIDGLMKDGLTDVYNQQAMGVCADLCADTNAITREDQDAFAIQSYTRAKEAWDTGKFKEEVIPVTVPQRRGEPKIVSTDEEYLQVKFEKIPSLRPAFSSTGTVTAANASTLNDGASAMVLMTTEKAEELGLTPIAIIKSYADAAQEPEWFTTAPSKALPKALIKAGLLIDDIDFFELNEAFAVVGLANQKILSIPNEKMNIHGGAVALGHPLGCSGARILTTLIHILNQNNGRYGAAAICNGGGGASTMIIENPNYNA